MPPLEPDLPLYEVRRAEGPIVVDGLLNDEAWKKANTMEFIFPWDAQTGAKQKTVARILWDDQNLYVGYDCEDTDITAHYTERDDPTYMDDCVELFINPDPNQLFYYGLEMNARATLYDYFRVYPYMGIKRLDFTGVQLATHIDGTLNMSGDIDKGWSLEVAIPWHNFIELTNETSAPGPGTIWTANLNRWDGTEPHRRLSQWTWSGLEAPDPHNPSRFGRLKFVG